VAGAILRGGGRVIQEESEAWVARNGRVSHSSPAWTSGGFLRVKYVIHAVGPVWGDGDEDAKLASAISGSLKVADQLKLSSVSFPALSTGIFGFPKDRAAGVIFSAIENYFSLKTSGIRLVRVVLYDEATINAFNGAWTRSAV
jgi:O-acetyl-ADP-ribose deacetylase (regulator of RNase III)